ncbi:MAG: hypothetical protein Q7S33_05915 [Nanoarchaeota archaeon]|nr:hypothetical protein [Nanoarchaeota archaeon]
MSLVSNKKAEILSIWWMLVLTIIGLGIVLGVLIYSGSGIDIRKIESQTLSDKILFCLSDNGNLNVKVLQDNFDIYSECGLNKDIFDSSGKYYFNIKIYDSTKKLVKEISAGNPSFNKDCAIEQEITADKYPKCSEISEQPNYNNEAVSLIILAGVNQKEKKESFS